MKNFTTKLKFWAVVLCACSLMYSCNDNDVADVLPSNSSAKQEVWVNEKTLHFEDVEAFTKTMELLQSKSESELDSWLETIGFKNSLRHFAVESEDEQGQIEVLDVPDPVFESILNADGIYVMGDEIHKVMEKYELVQNVDENIKLKDVDWLNEKDVIRHKIKYGAIDYKVAGDLKNVRLETRKYEPYNEDFVDAFGIPADEGVTTLSAHIEAWSRGYVGYASAGLRIKGRKLKSGNWTDDEMHYAGFTWEARARYLFPGEDSPFLDRTGSEYGSYTKKVGETCYYCVGCTVDVEYFDADFTYEDDGYPRVYKYNEYFNW